jgi:hypothetical protein
MKQNPPEAICARCYARYTMEAGRESCSRILGGGQPCGGSITLHYSGRRLERVPILFGRRMCKVRRLGLVVVTSHDVVAAAPVMTEDQRKKFARKALRTSLLLLPPRARATRIMDESYLSILQWLANCVTRSENCARTALDSCAATPCNSAKL